MSTIYLSYFYIPSTITLIVLLN